MLDRLDRLVLAGSAPRTTPDAPLPQVAPARPLVPEREPVITSKRGPRFVDYAPCPFCGYARIGVEYHGELMSGAKVHQLFAHSPGAAMVQKGKPRCLGAGMRVKFVASGWVSEAAS